MDDFVSDNEFVVKGFCDVCGRDTFVIDDMCRPCIAEQAKYECPDCGCTNIFGEEDD